MSMSKQEMQAKLESLGVIRTNLLAKKAKGPLTKAEQTQLESVSSDIFDLEELIDAPEAPEAPEAPAVGDYKVPENEKHLVHALVTKAFRFDPNTGQEINPGFVQKYSPKEFALCEKYASSTGQTYTILYKP